MPIAILELLDLGEKNQFGTYNVQQLLSSCPSSFLISISSFLHACPTTKRERMQASQTSTKILSKVKYQGNQFLSTAWFSVG